MEDLSQKIEESPQQPSSIGINNAVSASTKKKTSKRSNKRSNAALSKEEKPKQDAPPSEPFSYFGRHDTPNKRWFDSQLKADVTTEMHVVEFFHLLSTLSKRDDKISLLRKAKTDPTLMTLLNVNFNPSVYDPFKPKQEDLDRVKRLSNLPWGLNPYTLRQNIKRLRYLFNTSNEGKTVPTRIKENIFFEFVESLYPGESKIFVECFTQSLSIPGMDKSEFGQLVKDAFGKSRFPSL